jgi:hypothetical protein
MWLFDPSSPCIAILKFNALHKAFKARGKSSFPAGVWQPTTASTQLTTWMVRSGLAKPMAESIAGQDFQEKRQMLWTITIVLFVLWLLGMVSSYTLGGWIHLLLVLAVIVLIFNLLSGRRAV